MEIRQRMVFDGDRPIEGLFPPEFPRASKVIVNASRRRGRIVPNLSKVCPGLPVQELANRCDVPLELSGREKAKRGRAVERNIELRGYSGCAVGGTGKAAVDVAGEQVGVDENQVWIFFSS